MKHIFVTGGVVSGLGKGICAASLGRLLKQRGLRVRNQKFDPYLNVDPGTMSPYQHGEVFVTDDGAETDLDLGHYERFVDEDLTGNASVSSGKVYWNVLNRERQGGYLGGTVQIIPHVTDEIKRRIYAMDDGEADVVITEIGGTVGDIESQPFLEAIRQVAAEKGRENVLYHPCAPDRVHPRHRGAEKQAHPALREGAAVRGHPAGYSGVPHRQSPIAGGHAPEDRPVLQRGAGLRHPECSRPPPCMRCPCCWSGRACAEVVCRKLGLPQREPDLAEWTRPGAARSTECTPPGADRPGGQIYRPARRLSQRGGVPVPRGDGQRRQGEHPMGGLREPDGRKTWPECWRIAAAFWCPAASATGASRAWSWRRSTPGRRTCPIFGICLGMQIAVIEYARHVAGLGRRPLARSSPALTAHPVIALMPDQVGVTAKGGTMRLGKYPCVLAEGTLARAAYGAAGDLRAAPPPL